MMVLTCNLEVLAMCSVGHAAAAWVGMGCGGYGVPEGRKQEGAYPAGESRRGQVPASLFQGSLWWLELQVVVCGGGAGL